VTEQFEERQEFNLHETHFDIITEAAPGMTVLGFGKNTPVQMCCHGDHFLGALCAAQTPANVKRKLAVTHSMRQHTWLQTNLYFAQGRAGYHVSYLCGFSSENGDAYT